MTIKQINEFLSGSGYFIKEDPNDKGKAKPIQVENEDGEPLFRAKNIADALLSIGRGSQEDEDRFDEYQFLRGLLVKMGKRPKQITEGESYGREGILAMRKEVAAGRDLKRVLMDLGNSLVTEHRFDPGPSGVPYRLHPTDHNTLPLTVVTEFLNEHEEARDCLRDLGFEWSMPEGGFPPGRG